MDDKGKQLIEELIAHLEGAQGDDLMSLVQGTKKPEVASVESVDVMPMGKKDDGMPEAPENEATEDPKDDLGESDMSDSELAELLKEYLH